MEFFTFTRPPTLVRVSPQRTQQGGRLDGIETNATFTALATEEIPSGIHLRLNGPTARRRQLQSLARRQYEPGRPELPLTDHPGCRRTHHTGTMHPRLS